MKKLFRRLFGKERVSETTQKEESINVSSVSSEMSGLMSALGDQSKFFYWKDAVSDYPAFEPACREFVSQYGKFCDYALLEVAKLKSGPELILAHVKNGGLISYEALKIVLDYPNLDDIAIALAGMNYCLPHSEILGKLIDSNLATAGSAIKICLEYHGKNPKNRPLREDSSYGKVAGKLLKLANASQIMPMYFKYGGEIEYDDNDAWDKLFALPDAEEIVLGMVKQGRILPGYAFEKAFALPNVEDVMMAYVHFGHYLEDRYKKRILALPSGEAIMKAYAERMTREW